MAHPYQAIQDAELKCLFESYLSDSDLSKEQSENFSGDKLTCMHWWPDLSGVNFLLVILNNFVNNLNGLATFQMAV